MRIKQAAPLERERNFAIMGTTMTVTKTTTMNDDDDDGNNNGNDDGDDNGKDDDDDDGGDDDDEHDGNDNETTTRGLDMRRYRIKFYIRLLWGYCVVGRQYGMFGAVLGPKGRIQ
jgi:hypothetical protein